VIAPVFPPDENEGNPLLADLLSRYPLHRVSDFCSIVLERHGAIPQPRANPRDVRRDPFAEARRAYDRERHERRLRGVLIGSDGLGACTGPGNRHSALQPGISHEPTKQTHPLGGIE
jgi:hypothetical protein